MKKEIISIFQKFNSDINIMVNVLKENKKFLQSGKYHMIISEKKIIYLRNQESIEFIKKNKNHLFIKKINFSFKRLMKQFLLIFKKIECKNEEEFMIKGHLILITSFDNAKIFDFKQKKVLNFFNKDMETFYLIKQAYEQLSPYFKMPIIEFVDEEGYYVENYLNFTPYSEWTNQQKEKCISIIFENYKAYFEENKLIHSKEFKSSLHLKKRLNSEILNSPMFISKLNEWIGMEDFLFDTIQLHGDLKFKNILLYENEYYFIDLELSNKYIFFHDLFDLIFSEAMYNDNYYYIEEYLKGEYDDNFIKIFEVFNCEFNKERKMSYLAMFIAERLIEFERLNSQEIDQQFLDVYFHTFQNICKLEKHYS